MPSWISNLFTGDLTAKERQNVVRVVFWSAVLFHISWACGLIPGVSGFAVASDVDRKIADSVQPIKEQVARIEHSLAAVREEQRAARISQIERNLFDLRKSQCGAIKNENREAVEFYQRRLDAQLRAYRELVGIGYALPTCQEVGE